MSSFRFRPSSSSSASKGTLQRLRAMGLPFRLILAGKLLPFFVVNQIQAVMMVLVGIFLVPLFGSEALEMPASLPLLVNWWAVSAAVSLAAVAWALLIASIAQTSEQATIVGGVGNVLMGAIGGIMVPQICHAGHHAETGRALADGLGAGRLSCRDAASWQLCRHSAQPRPTARLRGALAGPCHLAQSPRPCRPLMNETLCSELKALIVEACDRDCDPASIGDDEALFGPEAPLQLDSLDALQLSMAIKKKYGLRLADSKETRRILSSVANMTGHLDAWLAQRR
ncbi:MAG: ABC transporter permease [Dechloromonas sp.]|uniref:ABC transporter permease n=1 Tax=Candidatus Dechloromonas phosphorivorans TaxID=2899244 RepID=A0A9D7LTA2_9RHOO|nr:ABC transporter permease [Candidatus Dechloromonas phosphorivorans]